LGSCSAVPSQSDIRGLNKRGETYILGIKGQLPPHQNRTEFVEIPSTSSMRPSSIPPEEGLLMPLTVNGLNPRIHVSPALWGRRFWSRDIDGTSRNKHLLVPYIHLADSILPPSGSRSAVTRKLMSTSLQGALGPSGHAGSFSGLAQPVSGNHVEPSQVLIGLEQISQEQSISNQIRKLTVRLLIGVSNLED